MPTMSLYHITSLSLPGSVAPNCLTHMELSDVEVGLDRTQFPCLILQKHPQLLQACPGGHRERKGWRKRKEKEKTKREEVSVCRLTTVAIYFQAQELLVSQSPR